MKKFSLLLLLLFTSFASWSQEYRAPSFKSQLCFDADDVVPQDVKVKGSSQGYAMWGRYGFSFHDKGQCIVFDMRRRSYVTTFRLSDNVSHCNNASWGVERYSKRSKFPLLYISACTHDKACYVTDITLTGSRTVQKIFYTGEDCGKYQDWFVDRKNGYLYSYGAYGDLKRVMRFALPPLSASDANGEVHLTKADALSCVDIEGIGIPQGSLIVGNYLYLPEGYPPHNCKLNVVDVRTGKIVETVDLSYVGIEPEGLDAQGRWLYISFHTSRQPRHNKIYRFRMR